MIEISVVLPLYKQANQIKRIVQTYYSFFKKSGKRFEIILVINGSQDGSYDIAQKETVGKKEMIVINREGKGWGFAVKEGLKCSSGKYLCYTNSARTNVTDVDRMLGYLSLAPDSVVKASRMTKDSWQRKLGSIIYNLEFRALFHVPVWDVNGTPKVFSKKTYKKINPHLNNDLFDAEFVAICKKKGISIIEIPIGYSKRIEGKSTTNLCSAIKMYIGLLKLKKL